MRLFRSPLKLAIGLTLLGGLGTAAFASRYLTCTLGGGRMYTIDGVDIWCPNGGSCTTDGTTVSTIKAMC